MSHNLSLSLSVRMWESVRESVSERERENVWISAPRSPPSSLSRLQQLQLSWNFCARTNFLLLFSLLFSSIKVNAKSEFFEILFEYNAAKYCENFGMRRTVDNIDIIN